MTRRLRVMFFGNFPVGEGYPRNRVIHRALEAAGIECVHAHAPLFLDPTSRKLALGSPWRVMRTALRAFTGMGGLARKYRRLREEVDLVYVGYGGLGDQWLARCLDRRRRLPLVADAFLSLYDTAVLDRKLYRVGSWRAELLRRLDRRIALRADCALVDTPMTAAFLSEVTGVEASRWTPVPVGSDLRAQEPAPGSRRVRGLFVGTGVPLHGSSVLLDAVKELEGRGAPFELCFVGGAPHDRLQVARSGLRSVRFIDRFVDRGELEELHGQCDLAFGVFDAGPKAARVVPCKVYDALAAGRPVITGDTPAARALLGDCECVLRVPPGDAVALADAVERLAAGDLRSAGRAAAEFFARRFSIERIGVRLREVFEGLVSSAQ